MITIVIGEGDVGQSAFASAVHPRLQQRLGEGLDPMALRVGVIVGEEFHAVKDGRRSAASLPYGAVMNFCRTRSSGNCGKKTSQMKTLFGERSRVAMVAG